MEGDICGVRIIPNQIDIRDTGVNKLRKVQITVKNVSKNSKEIRYYGPQTKEFKLKVKNPEKAVAPGCEVPGLVTYITPEAVEHTDRLVITVDGDVIEVPLKAYPSKPQLVLEGPVDFGNVVANSKVIAKEITLYNHGSKDGEFKLKYCGEKPIAIIPSSGKVPPKSAQIIKVEYVTKHHGKFDEVVKMRLEGQETTHLRVLGNVVEGRLELLDYHSEEPSSCVKFGASYYGTDKTESAILYNNGPDPVCFVAILNEDAIGQEVGLDLAGGSSTEVKGQMNTLTSLVTAIPNQGMLAPYEKIPMFFRFSPRWNGSKQGFNCSLQPPPRQDFALFMQLKVVGASDGFEVDGQERKKSNVEGSSLEIALTGTALPVLLSLSLQGKHDFGECPVGEHVDALCKLSNDSQVLPVNYQFRRMAHFIPKPSDGKIKPGKAQDIIVSFAPNQVGSFKPTQYIDVIGQVADNKNPFLMHLETIYSLPVVMIGKSAPISVKKEPVFNPGITPKISNEVGMYVDTTQSTVEKNNPRNALHGALDSKLHRKKTQKNAENADKTLVAFPNDRSQSIRPSNRRENYKTIFTHTDRHTYVDPDYSYTDEEMEIIHKHKQYYVDFIDYLRNKRKLKLQATEFRENDNEVDMHMQPASGIKPRKIKVDEVKPDPRPPTPPNQPWKMLSTKELAEIAKNTSSNKKDGLNAIPTTAKEKSDCTKILSPQQLHQVIIGPPTIDFGEVCLKSVSQKQLHIVNNLDQYIHVNVHVDCRELRQTSPLSQVVPPQSKAVLPLILESSVKGRFQRSLDYTINGFYKSHVTVFAEVVPVALELSTDELILEPQIGLPADAGIRGVITLKNKLNYPAEFVWNPILSEKGTAFSIRPATGIVDCFTELDCEVVFHPSFVAPEEGLFSLQVHGGNSLKLQCKAKLGPTNVTFIDRRIQFGQVPIHLTSVRTAMLKNSSLNHAYFQVLDPNPFPGLTVTPVHGVVPVGGTAELKCHLTPNAIIKFDTRVNVCIRGWKTVELRMGGTVEPPIVDIDLPNFNFGGIYCGSSSVLPFRLVNKANTKARLEFDISRFADFTLDFPGVQTAEDVSFQMMNPGLYTLTIDAGDIVEAYLIFKPTEVASYDFVMPVSINQTNAPTPSATPFPPTPAPSNKNSLQHIINPRPVPITIATPRRKVMATALRQPLQISNLSIEFYISPSVHEMASQSGLGQSQVTVLVNNSDKPLKWCVDLERGNKCVEDGIFKFLHSGGMPFLTHGDGGVEGTLEPGQSYNLGIIFCPDKPGHYECRLPFIVHDDYDHPYQYITIMGELKSPKIWFDPLAIVMTPVPLDTEVSQEFIVQASNYMRKSRIEAEVPTVECEDGSTITPLRVFFPSGQDIKPCCGDDGYTDPHVIPCKVTFKSPKPISFSQPIKFVDDLGNSFYLPVTATADNCLLTCYPFLAQHRTDHQIVCEQGLTLRGRSTASRESMNVGEAVLIPCSSANNQSRPSTTATSSDFEVSSSSYEDSSASASDSSCTSLYSQYSSFYLIPVLIDTDSTGNTFITQACSCPSTSTANTDAIYETPGLMDPSTNGCNTPASDNDFTTISSPLYSEYQDSNYPSTPRDGALNKFAPESAAPESRGRRDLQSRSLGSALFPEEDTEEGIFHTEVLLAAQRWFSSQGWPGGPNPISIPENLRSGISKRPTNEEKSKSSKGTQWESSNLKKEFKTVYDMVAHLIGKHIPGIPINNPLPSDPWERAKQIYWQHSTLLTFMKTQGASVASIKPEYLMEPADYRRWVLLQKELELARNKSGKRDIKMKTEEEEAIEDQLFEAVSKRAWVDVLLQLLKTVHLSRITPRQFKNLPSPYKNSQMPMVDPDPLCSNVYGIGERIVLLWMNHNYERQRDKIWANGPKGGTPPSRWVVNFDFDLLDGLVLAAILGAHVPFLVKTHLRDMYTHPATAEQCLHNALKVVNAMRSIGIDYDIQAIDITDPNPISLLLLCVHLYFNLPQYLPKNYVEFSGGLHCKVHRQVRLSNPSTKPLTYHAMIAGHDARDFNLPKGDTISIGSKGSASVQVDFTSRYLRPAEAVLVLVGRRQGSNLGSTLVFTLRTSIDSILPKVTLKCESPVYDLRKLPVEVTNPFNEGGTFKIVLVETFGNMSAKATDASAPRGSDRKPKKARSKINNGRKRADSPEEEVQAAPLAKAESKESLKDTLSAFSTPCKTVDLDPRGTGEVEIHFLPFQTGHRQCNVIFVCEEVGEFIYCIDAVGTDPLPSEVPYRPTANSVRISSAAAAGSGRGAYGGDPNIIYWKCEVGKTLKEKITVNVNNDSREKALVMAAQEHMSAKELERRKLTGTLGSGTLSNKAMDMLSTGAGAMKFTTAGDFSVKCDNSMFRVPKTLNVPKAPSTSRTVSAGGQPEAQTVELPIEFVAKKAGHFPCKITLKANDDVRVFQIECTVTPEGSNAAIEFSSPVHQPITQDIPIVNETNHDWPMEAHIEGDGFVGPNQIIAKAYQTTHYPLLFRPTSEKVVQGKLLLKNTVDDVDHTFTLTGKGDRPLPLEEIKLKCQVRQKIEQVLTIPNVTNKKIFYRVESDLNMLSGPDSLCVLPGQVGKYEMTVMPNKRGDYKGVISFVSSNNPVKEVDSDGEEASTEDSDNTKGYRVWYSMSLEVTPAPPEKTLHIQCACQKKAVMEVGVTNPLREEDITLSATVSGPGLDGPSSISLPPKSRSVYKLVYFPGAIGQYTGSLIFYHEQLGEFWYELTLKAEPPTPTTLPQMECELGRWTRQFITLSNPTDETLQLIPMISNTNNFSLERDNDQPIELRPHSTIKIPLTFMPSSLGFTDHQAKISFLCEQVEELGEWIFNVTGHGTLPSPQDPVSITAMAGSNSTLIIPFRNPLDMPVLANVYLLDGDQESRGKEITNDDETPFCLLLRQNMNIRLGPKSTLDIPISFAPEDMKKFVAKCVVVVGREDGTSWKFILTDDKGTPLSRTNSGGVREIKWIYPVHGYPELTSSKDSPPALVECRARERLEERLEVYLSGVAPSAGGPKRGARARAVTPNNKEPELPDGVVVGKGMAVAEEFTFEVVYPTEDSRKDLESAVVLSLVRKQRYQTNGHLVLVFNVIFSPNKTMRHDVELLVQGATGGFWRFPLRMIASEPTPDDTITIEAVGLNKVSSVGFRINSQAKYPLPYNAYFVAGSDPEFSVVPSSGELLPTGTMGTLIKVDFLPNKYGKTYNAKLVVQTEEIQWTYTVRGVLPEYRPPRLQSSRPMAGPHPDPRYRPDNNNFIRDNMQLATTAVSSPIKGAPILKRMPRQGEKYEGGIMY